MESSDRGTRSQRARVEDGMTLVEMMVAILVLGVVLSALAATLITSLRTIVLSEAETTATALAQQEIERLQSTPWEVAGLLDTEVAAGPAEWTDRLDGLGRFEGDDLATITASEGMADRPHQAPRLFTTDDESGYSVARYITWVDRSADGFPDTRRFTVVVTWEDASRERELVVEGERAPTPAEASAAADELRLLNFFRSPDPAAIAADGQLTQDVNVEVRVTKGVILGRLRYHEATLILDDDAGTPTEPAWTITYQLVDVPMTAVNGSLSTSGGHLIWRHTIPAGSGTFVDGTMPIQFRASEPSAGEFTALASLTLVGREVSGTYPTPGSGSETDGSEGDVAPDPEPVPETDDDEDFDGVPDAKILSAEILGAVCRSSDWRLSKPVVVRVLAEGLSDSSIVDATYTYRAKDNTGAGQVRTATVSVDFVNGGPSSATFELTIPAGGDRYFASTDKLEFNIEARRSDGDNDSSKTAPKSMTPAGTSPC